MNRTYREVKGYCLGLYTKTLISGNGNTVLAFHANQATTIIVHNTLQMSTKQFNINIETYVHIK